MSLCNMIKGGSPQFWRLVSRELIKAKRAGILNEGDIQKLIQMRLKSRSQKFFLTSECMTELGIEANLDELDDEMGQNYQAKYRHENHQ